jgi:hypothetical protein
MVLNLSANYWLNVQCIMASVYDPIWKAYAEYLSKGLIILIEVRCMIKQCGIVITVNDLMNRLAGFYLSNLPGQNQRIPGFE